LNLLFSVNLLTHRFNAASATVNKPLFLCNAVLARGLRYVTGDVLKTGLSRQRMANLELIIYVPVSGNSLLTLNAP
jgi:hypothetical protein